MAPGRLHVKCRKAESGSGQEQITQRFPKVCRRHRLPADKITEIHAAVTTILAAELRRAAAVKLFELGRISCGAAARLAGVPQAVLLSRLAESGVDIFKLTEEELGRETPLA
jgi:predicted HTH domain antitoxin